MNIEAQKAYRDGLEEYRRGVETLMRLRSSKFISNSEPAHAAILFDIFFKNATRNIKIFCRKLNKEVFANDFIVASAREAVARGVDVSILLQDQCADDTPFSQWAKANREQKVRLVSTASESIKNADFNFTVMDDLAFRFEENRNDCHAIAGMNHPKMAEVFADKFSAFISLPTNAVRIT